MILQSLVFPERDGVEELYIRREGCVEKKAEGIFLDAGSVLQTDTYFNGFFSDEWKKYTEITGALLNIKVIGRCEIEIFQVRSDGERKKLQVFHTAEEGEQECVHRVNIKQINGMIAFQIRALGKVKLNYAVWESEDPVQRDIGIAIVTCTYKKEKYIKRNIQYLKRTVMENPDDNLYRKLYFYIVDNGRTLKENFGEDIQIIPNENTGGAGGFCRGMKAAFEQREERKFTHVLLMDDDVTVEAEALRRTYVFLTYQKSSYGECFLGGSMLRQDFPYIQHEAGGRWMDGKLRSIGCGFDLRKTEMLMKNGNPSELPNYAAWWYCCMPISYIERNGFPMPFFLHFDDIEYSLRETQNPIYINGVGIWHEQFEQKQSSALIYYDMRNTLFTYRLHAEKYEKKRVVQLILYAFYQSIARYRYRDIELIALAVEDYQKGWDWLRKQNPESLHMEILKKGYHWEIHREVILPEESPMELCKVYSKDEKRTDRIRRLLTINGALFPVKFKNARCLTLGAPLHEFYRVKRIYLYDPDTRKGGWVEKSWIEFFKSAKILLSMIHNIIKT